MVHALIGCSNLHPCHYPIVDVENCLGFYYCPEGICILIKTIDREQKSTHPVVSRCINVE